MLANGSGGAEHAGELKSYVAKIWAFQVLVRHLS